MTAPLVLSLFPGIGLLDMAFEEAGFCVVRGPDLLWGGDIRHFHPPPGKFDGVIGGPPCQEFSALRSLIHAATGRGSRHGNQIPEFERCVRLASPRWFVMECATRAPEPDVVWYGVDSVECNNHWLGEEQRRVRRISFGTRADIGAAWARVMCAELLGQYVMGPLPKPRGAVTSSDGGASVKMERYRLPEMLRLQGLAEEFFGDDCPLTVDARRKMIGNGVPLPMGRAIAKAVKRTMYPELTEASA